MSVVKINVIQVPPERAEILEQRFASRAGEVDTVDGFESFDLLRPTEGFDRYLVITRWRDDAAFEAWMSSPAFTKGHAQSAGDGPPADQPSGDQGGGHPGGTPGGGHPGGAPGGQPGGGHPGGDQPSGPAATGSELWGFEVVTSATGSNP